MEFIMETSALRQLAILKKILRSTEPISLIQLAEENKVVLSTIKNDLSVLKEITENKWEFKLKDRKVYLQKPLNEDYDTVYKKYLIEGFLYKFLAITFRTNKPSSVIMCQQLYVSHSHFYKKIAKLQKILPEGITIDLNSLSLIGDELKIRCLYYSLIKFSGRPEDFSIYSEDLNNELKWLKKIETHFEVNFSLYLENLYSVWLTICTRRYRQSPIQLTHFSLSIVNPVQQFIRQELKKAAKEYSLLSEDELLARTLIWYIYPFPYYANNQLAKKALIKYKDQLNEDYFFTCRLLNIQDIDTDKKELMLYIIDTLYILPIAEVLITIQGEKYEFPPAPSFLPLELVMEKISRVNTQLTYGLSTYQIEILSKIIIHHLCCSLTESSINPIIINIHSKFGLTIEKDIGKLIRSKYKEFVQIQHSHTIATFNPDIIISDYPEIKNFYKKNIKKTFTFLAWEIPNTSKNWQELDVAITQLIYQQT
ncbi:helix-turn-helix domain-containing protein [Enterococcus hirae]|uniref:helix-turn-helix domain-containing protein n=1 Tax=Enterococcus hirae TaxID=1354 RepID=UPI0034582A74